MRKLILISALLLASASAQAGPTSGVALAAADTPAAASTDTTAQPLPPAAQGDTAKPDASTPAAQPHSAKQRSHARSHESDEAKARRIAAKYGISW